MSKIIKGFMDFVREQGVVGVAVGIAVGLQAGKLVEVMVQGFINPIVAILLQGTDFSGIESVVEVGKTQTTFMWGAIIQAAITLIATAFVVYFLVDRLGLTKADKKKN